MNIRVKTLAAITPVLGALVFWLLAPGLQARQEYADQAGKTCSYCHRNAEGGSLNAVGAAYIRNSYRTPVPDRLVRKSEKLQSPFYKTVRLVAGYVHLIAAVLLAGTILYVHLFIRPSRLISGIPPSERKLGLSSMAVLVLTGAFLTWTRIDSFGDFFRSDFGLFLFIKIVLFLLMICSALVAVTYVQRKLRARSPAGGGDSAESGVSSDALAGADGKSGRAYIAYKAKVYDVSASAKWKEGRHFGKHSAGIDLTDHLASAPHGEEVLERVELVGDLQPEPEPGRPEGVQRLFQVLAGTNLTLVLLILFCVASWSFDLPGTMVKSSRPLAERGKSCVECHRAETPGIYFDWKSSSHALVDVDCYDCHAAGAGKDVVVKSHLEHDKTPISLVVSPKDCGECHPQQAKEYERSKHAHTLEIIHELDYWLRHGMNNAIERRTGCYSCHGSEIKLADGKPAAGTWPNVGVGRINPDGSRGCCSSCHTRHRFSLAEARKPEACDQCHLGPDHPQIEIYNESKHGTIYHAEGHAWTWNPEDGNWRAGEDYRAPTCATCHMSATPEMESSHDVTERLAWESQAPLTVRPSEFKPFPADTDWSEEREKMKSVCYQCHSSQWADEHFTGYDRAIENYNLEYMKPVKKMMDDLYGSGFLSRDRYFDEDLEWEYYEFWHHEGRRARMGAAMMAPDYAWWHGFYELKHRYLQIREEYESLSGKKAETDFAGRYDK